jgi:hypothetical protein
VVVYAVVLEVPLATAVSASTNWTTTRAQLTSKRAGGNRVGRSGSA